MRGAVQSASGALALAFLAEANTAAAAGFAAARFGGEQGHVTTTNPTCLYYNPAGMAFAEGVHLFADGTLALRRLSWTHSSASTDIPDPPGAAGANSGTAELFNVFGGPMAGVTARFGNLGLGLAFSVPFGGRADWNQNQAFEGSPSYPLAKDGVQRWHNVQGELRFVYLTLGAAYRVGPVGLGAAANLIRSSVQNTHAKNPTGLGDPDTMHEGRSSLDVSGWQGSFALGVMLEAVPKRVWLGASYQAQPALGPMKLAGTLTLSYQGEGRPYPVHLQQALPDILRAGARYRVTPHSELRLFGDLTRWSVLQTQCVAVRNQPCAVYASGADATPGATTIQNIRRRWRDTFGLRAGASLWLNRSTELFLGAGFETAAVPDATLEPSLADASHLEAALGARFELSPSWFIAGSYTHLGFLVRDNTGKSVLANAEPPTRWPDGGGRYSQWVGLINANLEKVF